MQNQIFDCIPVDIEFEFEVEKVQTGQQINKNVIDNSGQLVSNVNEIMTVVADDALALFLSEQLIY